MVLASADGHFLAISEFAQLQAPTLKCTRGCRFCLAATHICESVDEALDVYLLRSLHNLEPAGRNVWPLRSHMLPNVHVLVGFGARLRAERRVYEYDLQRLVCRRSTQQCTELRASISRAEELRAVDNHCNFTPHHQSTRILCVVDVCAAQTLQHSLCGGALFGGARHGIETEAERQHVVLPIAHNEHELAVLSILAFMKADTPRQHWQGACVHGRRQVVQRPATTEAYGTAAVEKHALRQLELSHPVGEPPRDALTSRFARRSTK